MGKESAYKLLDHPFVYNLAQIILAPGSRGLLIKRIKKLFDQFPKSERILDIGCGPQSWLWQIEQSPVGLDITYSYCEAFHEKSPGVVTASSATLPISDLSFGSVWSIGMFHHLPDDVAKQAISEMLRVCENNGYVAIIDAVLPVNKWLRPFAYFIRKRDRGKFVRTQKAFEALLPCKEAWNISRALYSYNGMEVLVCWIKRL